VRRRAQEVYNRNMKVWASIKKPSPAAFFENLLPYPADGFFRQAMVLSWMMMPRTGGRDVKDVRKIVTAIFERNVTAWEQDNRLFTGAKAGKTKKPAKSKVKSKAKKKSGPKKR
ncbi:MAG: hypothetical protein ABUS49_09310, partial [Acidobacteriota bacterium]